MKTKALLKAALGILTEVAYSIFIMLAAFVLIGALLFLFLK